MHGNHCIGTMLDGTWSVEEIAEAFAGPLSADLEAVGYGASRWQPGSD